MSSKKKMTQKDVQRIQSAVAKKNGGKIPKGSYVSRLQKIVAKNPESN